MDYEFNILLQRPDLFLFIIFLFYFTNKMSRVQPLILICVDYFVLFLRIPVVGYLKKKQNIIKANNFFQNYVKLFIHRFCNKFQTTTKHVFWGPGSVRFMVSRWILP